MRLGFLDGLRGWGAIFVLLYHVFCTGLVPSPAFAYLKYLVPFNGTFAVLVFFIVSGFALSARYLVDGDKRSLLAIAAGRYIRLAVPIFAACLVMHLAMLAGLISGDRLPAYAPFFNFEPTTAHLLKFALFDVFFNYSNAITYIGPLWTMRPELLGSFLVLGGVLLIRPVPFRLPLACIVAVAIIVGVGSEIGAMLGLFVIGVAFADGFNRGWAEAMPRSLALLLIAVGCLSLLLPYSVPAWSLFGAAPLVAGCVAHPVTRRWLETPFSAYLGKISFPLYLIHGPVINIVGEPLMRGTDGIGWRIAIDLLVIVLSLVAGRAFVPVNDFAVWLSRRFGSLVRRSVDQLRPVQP